MGKVEPTTAIFLEEFNKRVPTPSPTLQEFTKNLSENFMTDLSPTHGYFAPETQDQLAAEAARRWAEKSRGADSRAELRSRWGEEARDFHVNNLWSYPTVARRMKRPKKKNIAVTMLWTSFSSFVGTKCLVLYFGSAELNEPSTTNQVCLIMAVLFSFATLFYFAFKNGKAFEKEKTEQERR